MDHPGEKVLYVLFTSVLAPTDFMRQVTPHPAVSVHERIASVTGMVCAVRTGLNHECMQHTHTQPLEVNLGRRLVGLLLAYIYSSPSALGSRGTPMIFGQLRSMKVGARVKWAEMILSSSVFRVWTRQND